MPPSSYVREAFRRCCEASQKVQPVAMAAPKLRSGSGASSLMPLQRRGRCWASAPPVPPLCHRLGPRACTVTKAPSSFLHGLCARGLCSMESGVGGVVPRFGCHAMAAEVNAICAYGAALTLAGTGREKWPREWKATSRRIRARVALMDCSMAAGCGRAARLAGGEEVPRMR